MVGMDPRAWSVLADWFQDRRELPVGPLSCVIDGRTRGRAWSPSAVRVELRHLSTTGTYLQGISTQEIIDASTAARRR